MKTIEQLKTEQAKELAKAQAEINIAEKCPIVPDGVMKTGKETGNYWITHKVKGIAGAVDVINTYQDHIIPAYELRDGCLKILPLDLYKEDHKENTTLCSTFFLNVSQGEGFGPSVKLSFFVDLPDGGIVKICCHVEGPGYIGVYSKLSADFDSIRDRRGRIVRKEKNRNMIAAATADRVISWAGSGCEGSADYTYLFDDVFNIKKLAARLGEE